MKKISKTQRDRDVRDGLRHRSQRNLKILLNQKVILVLTAELSKWEDSLPGSLTPRVDRWEPEVFQKLHHLGFFNIFKRGSQIENRSGDTSFDDIKLVPYIKGHCSDGSKATELKDHLTTITGDNIAKWPHLYAGLSEAITNVSHHAYPNYDELSSNGKFWYLTAGYKQSENELKIVFYDQGVGIPATLPESGTWERALGFIEKMGVLPIAGRYKDEVLLEAAVNINRTSTSESDRGKGLQDLLEYVRQIGDGYLSILSGQGLYRFNLNRENQDTKTFAFKTPVCGTLIIWKVCLS